MKKTQNNNKSLNYQFCIVSIHITPICTKKKIQYITQHNMLYNKCIHNRKKNANNKLNTKHSKNIEDKKWWSIPSNIDKTRNNYILSLNIKQSKRNRNHISIVTKLLNIMNVTFVTLIKCYWLYISKGYHILYIESSQFQ